MPALLTLGVRRQGGACDQSNVLVAGSVTCHGAPAPRHPGTMHKTIGQAIPWSCRLKIRPVKKSVEMLIERRDHIGLVYKNQRGIVVARFLRRYLAVSTDDQLIAFHGFAGSRTV